MIAYTLSSREYARELIKLQSMDKGNKKGLITGIKAEESGATMAETNINGTSTATSICSNVTGSDNAGKIVAFSYGYLHT